MCPRNPILPYNPKLRGLARQLRKNSTFGEILLWQAIKGRALGVEFHRQVPVGEYIVDFFCHERVLAIEIDGSHHDHAEAFTRDIQRQEALERMGVRFMRFREEEIRRNLPGVVETIGGWIERNP